MRAEVATPLIEQAIADGTAYLTARQRMWEATAAHNHAGRLGKRAADRAATDAANHHRATEDTARTRWGGVPQTTAGVPSWAQTVAKAQVDTNPRVADANRDAEHTHCEQQRLTRRRTDERAVLRGRIFGNQLPGTPEASAAQWRGRAEQARGDLAEIEALPVTEAAQLVRDQTARVQAKRAAAERAQAARDARAAQLHQFQSPSIEQESPRPERDGIGM